MSGKCSTERSPIFELISFVSEIFFFFIQKHYIEKCEAVTVDKREAVYNGMEGGGSWRTLGLCGEAVSRLSRKAIIHIEDIKIR